MKKVISILTILVATMGVSFVSNAQGQALPYTMDVGDISDWSVGYEGNYNPNDPYAPEATYAFIDDDYNTLTLEKQFDFSNSTDAEINFEFISEFGSIEIGYRIEIDGVEYFNEAPTNLNVNDIISLNLGDIDSFLDPNNVSIVIYIECETELGNFIGRIDNFEITHTISNVGIEENDLSDKLEVYSFDKSIFISADESMNADVTVYNLSGQIITTNNVNLSGNKTELYLNSIDSGIYFVKIEGNNTIYQTKIYM